jgi:general secretion pathway protein A
MYESFYGLKENPFKVTPDPRFLYLGENHKEALAQLLYGVKESKGFIVITGEVGAGKTTLLYSLLERIDSNGHMKTAFLFNPKLDVNDFILYILRDLGVKVRRSTKGDYLQALHGYLLDAYKQGKKVVLIVDEAQGLKPELLEEIRLLSNLETSKSKLLQIVLVGQPELNRTLLDPGFRQLKQRINLRYHLAPLSEKETNEYIEKRLKIAGSNGGAIFTPKAISEIYRRSKGIPRVINILCDNTLLTAYALDQKVVDVKPVMEAAKDLKLARGIPAAWVWICLPILIGLAVLVLGLWQEHGFFAEAYNLIHRGFQTAREVLVDKYTELYELFRYWLG